MHVVQPERRLHEPGHHLAFRQQCPLALRVINGARSERSFSITHSLGLFLTGVQQAREEGSSGCVEFSVFYFHFFWRQAVVASYIAHLRFVDPVTKVAGVAVLHDDAQAVLVEEGVGVTDDVGMAHAPEEFHLVPAGLLLLGGDVLQLDDLRVVVDCRPRGK